MSSTEQPVAVFLLDDEVQVTDSLTWLLESISLKPRAFQRPADFLAALAKHHGPLCAVIDLRMPQMSGLEVQQEIARNGHPIPLLFLSAHGDTPAAVSAVKAGALTFLRKPFRPQEFLDAIRALCQQAILQHERNEQRRVSQELLKTLSVRELQVLRYVLQGWTSKEVARTLSISPKTVDVHRSNLAAKLGSNAASELHARIDAGVLEELLVQRVGGG